MHFIIIIYLKLVGFRHKASGSFGLLFWMHKRVYNFLKSKKYLWEEEKVAEFGFSLDL